MIAFFHPEDRVEIVILQGRNVRGIGTQTIFGDKELQVGMILAQLGHKALGGIPFAILLGRPITVDNRLGMSGITARWSGWMIAAPNIWCVEVMEPLRCTRCQHEAQ